MKAGKLKELLEQICKEYGEDIEVHMECLNYCTITDVLYIRATKAEGGQYYEEIRLTDNAVGVEWRFAGDPGLGTIRILSLVNNQGKIIKYN